MLVILGGSSPWTLSLLRLLEGEEVMLVGRDEGALEAIRGWARAMSLNRVSVSIDPPAALGKASLVLCQARIGGWQARYSDEAQPPRWGAYGDETVGIGGLRSALRACSVVSQWARAAAGVPAIIVTNPTDLITRQWASVSGGATVSACEVPSVLLGGLPVGTRYLGVNHLGWAELPDGSRRSTRWVSLLADLGSQVESQRRSCPARPRVVSGLSRLLLETLRCRDYEATDRVLALRPALWYERIVAPLVRAYRSGTVFDDVIGLPNGGRLPGVSADVIVESLSSARAPILDGVPRSLVADVSSFAHARDRAWQFMHQRDPAALIRYLDADPFAAQTPASLSLLRWLTEPSTFN